jgi:hypothetical protein
MDRLQAHPDVVWQLQQQQICKQNDTLSENKLKSTGCSLIPVAKLPPVSTTLEANLPPVSTTPAAIFSTSFASVIDTGGKFATSVNDTGGKSCVVYTGGQQWEQLSNC